MKNYKEAHEDKSSIVDPSDSQTTDANTVGELEKPGEDNTEENPEENPENAGEKEENEIEEEITSELENQEEYTDIQNGDESLDPNFPKVSSFSEFPSESTIQEVIPSSDNEEIGAEVDMSSDNMNYSPTVPHNLEEEVPSTESPTDLDESGFEDVAVSMLSTK